MTFVPVIREYRLPPKARLPLAYSTIRMRNNSSFYVKNDLDINRNDVGPIMFNQPCALAVSTRSIVSAASFYSRG